MAAGGSRAEGSNRSLRRWRWIAKGPRDVSVLVVLGVVVASTLFLAVRSTAIHRATTVLTRETESLIAPALHAAQDLIIELALERDELLHYRLTGDTAAFTQYQRHAASRAEAMTQLATLATQLNGAPARHVRRLQQLEEQWIATNRAVERGPVPASPTEQSFEATAAVFRAMLQESTLLEESIRTSLEDAWARVSAAERIDWYYTLGQVLVALAASVFIVRLVQRIRRLAEESERRRQQAESAMEDRARLIRGITHDVKNPLGVADMSAQLLEMNVPDPLTTGQQETVARIRRGIGGALAIVHDLLELSRAETGRLALNLGPVDAPALVRSIVDDHRSEAAARRITLEVDLHEGLPQVTTDEHRVRQILDNLVSNAFKFTPEGRRITVGASTRRDDADGRVRLVLFVANEGPGIRPEERDRIFTEFYRTEDAIARTSGVGLGLAISLRVARLLGGDIEFSSEPGRLTMFCLMLPVQGGVPRAGRQ